MELYNIEAQLNKLLENNEVNYYGTKEVALAIYYLAKVIDRKGSDPQHTIAIQPYGFR